MARAVLCGCLGCSHVASRGDDQCSSCLYHDDSSCPCTCGGCRLPEAEVSVQVPLREDTPSDTLCSLGDALCSLCSLPGCFSRTPVDEASGIRARCCGSSHEKVLLRLSLCPSVVPRGPLFPVEVSYFPGVGSRAPAELLVFKGMLVGDLAAYVLSAFLEGTSSPHLWQVRLMPGAHIVHDSDSYLLFPSAPGHTIEWRSQDQGATIWKVGVRPHSLLSLTRLPSLVPYPGVDSDTDSLGPGSYEGASPDEVVSAPLSVLAASPAALLGPMPDGLPESTPRSGSGTLDGVGDQSPVSTSEHSDSQSPGGASEGTRVHCVFPGCPDFARYDLLTYTQERCCGLLHEQTLMRLEQCPSFMPSGPLILVSVYGPDHDIPGPPIQLLLSSRMTVDALVEYFFMVFFGHNPNKDGLSPFGGPTDVPHRWQVTFPFLTFPFLPCESGVGRAHVSRWRAVLCGPLSPPPSPLGAYDARHGLRF